MEKGANDVYLCQYGDRLYDRFHGDDVVRYSLTESKPLATICSSTRPCQKGDMCCGDYVNEKNRSSENFFLPFLPGERIITFEAVGLNNPVLFDVYRDRFLREDVLLIKDAMTGQGYPQKDVYGEHLYIANPRSLGGELTGRYFMLEVYEKQ